MPKISQKIESKSNFKLFENFPRQKNFRILKFFSKSKCHFICSKDVFIRCGVIHRREHMFGIYHVCTHKASKTIMYTCMWTYECRMWEVENEIDFLVVLYFCFIKRHVETVTFFPKLPFFWKNGETNLFLSITTYVSSI